MMVETDRSYKWQTQKTISTHKKQKQTQYMWQLLSIPLQIGDEHLAPATDHFAYGK
jgi:hypothetical protein